MSREKLRPQWCQKHENWFDLDDGCPNCKVLKGDRGGPGSLAMQEDAEAMAVEITAKCIYEDLMPYDKWGGTKPAWVENGNSLKQDEARNHARKILGLLPSMQEDDITRQRERAVIEAAKLWRNCNDHESWHKAGEALVNALDALTASEPVDPQTLEPGTRFRWANADCGKKSPIMAVAVYTDDSIGDDYHMQWLAEDGRVYVFGNGIRVLPLPDDTE